MAKTKEAVTVEMADSGLAKDVSPGVAIGSADELEAVRTLLLGDERTKIEAALHRLDLLENRLSDPESRALDASEVLVPAMRLRLSADEELGDALKPVVVEQFHQTARHDPDVMAEALFPILGPAIRKMIAGMLSPDKNRKKRSYQLEQLFLIEKESGLPVCHVSSDAASTQDADMVSGMLSAIQSFVHEAFSADEFDGLNTLQVGELSVWIEWGPSAVLAGVIRGVGPQQLRDAMQMHLEQIHQTYADELSNYEGDSSAFDPLRPDLIHFLDSHDGSLANKVRNLPERAKRWLAGLAMALFCLVIWLLFNTYDAYRWSRYVASVEAQPGIVLTRNERSFRDYRLSGLKDPLAQDPATLLSESSINPDYVLFQFEAYQALHPGFTLERVKKLLEPPAGVTLSLDGSTLRLGGEVDQAWYEEAAKLARLVTGIEHVVLDN